MILLVAMTLVFMLATVTLLPFSIYSVEVAKAGTAVSITVLVALLVCLIPTTIGGLLSAIGVAGMGRMMRANVIATSGRAVEAAGDCDVLLLDKTGTITFGNRQASALHAVAGVTQHQLAEATLLASLGDETPEGKSIVALAKRAFGIVPPPLEPGQFTIIPFSAQTRMSGVTYRGARSARAPSTPFAHSSSRKAARSTTRPSRASRKSRAAAQHRSSSRKAGACSVLSSSRTSSRRRSRSASPSCAGWASRPS
jgi:K+-transporting ATPase ATPase B chain